MPSSIEIGSFDDDCPAGGGVDGPCVRDTPDILAEMA
jgi:hypothetical protein